MILNGLLNGEEIHRVELKTQIVGQQILQIENALNGKGIFNITETIEGLIFYNFFR